MSGQKKQKNKNDKKQQSQQDTIPQAPMARQISKMENWLSKYRQYLGYRSLLFITLVFVVAGSLLINYFKSQPDPSSSTGDMIEILHMGLTGLILLGIYFSAVEYLFKKRSEPSRLTQRFLWYLAMIFIVLVTTFWLLSYLH